MSQADARLFLERVIKNDALRQSLLALPEGAEQQPQQLVRLGSQHGLTFTEAELADAWADSLRAGATELGDAELEAVAGGIDSQLLQFAVQKLSSMVEATKAMLEGQAGVQKHIIQNIR